MAGAAHDGLGGRRVLLAVAAPAEARAVLDALEAPDDPPLWRAVEVAAGVDLVLTGVGKASAAGGVARALDAARHGAALSVGVAGALPGSGLALGSRVLATVSVFADEGADTPAGFVGVAQMGFPPAGLDSGSVVCDAALVAALAPIADATGPIATVSTCAGADDRAELIARRTGALAEAMEGAAVGVVAAMASRGARAPIAFAELRVISNTTGDRDRQRWNLAGALAALGQTAREAVAVTRA